MKTFILLTTIACFHISYALMSVNEFRESGLLKCYDTNVQDSRRVSLRNINGQVLPLPNSIETFVSLVERYESFHPNSQVFEVVGKFLKFFRIDDLQPDIDDELTLRDSVASSLQNNIKRFIFSVPERVTYDVDENDFTEDEQCALHFMLSHTVNDSKVDERDEVLEDTNKVKHPRELGVVSLHSRKKHAFALGRVLLGIYAGYLPSDNEDVINILKRGGKNPSNKAEWTGVKVNVVYAVTLGDLISRLIVDEKMNMLPNGEWPDTSCPIEYKLEDNNGGFVTYSELRGAVDGLIIGKKIQENRLEYGKFKLSQILRQYYGFSGMIDNERSQWCSRERILSSISQLDTEMYNFNRLYRFLADGGSPSAKTSDKIQNVINEVRNNIFKDVENIKIAGAKTSDKIQNVINEVGNNIFEDVERDECSISELSLDRKYVSPRNIFAILDYSSSGSTRLNFQAEVIGNLSSDFDLRPHGNLIGVYSNLKPLHQNTLDVIVKNSGISGCASCFAKHYARSGNKEDDGEIFRDLNDTLTTFETEQEELEEKYQSIMKAGSPGKVVLYFNFGTPNYDHRARDAIWELKRYFGGVTILAIGENRETLANFVDNDQTDLFPSNMKSIQDIKQRINKIPGEFTFKGCGQSTPNEAENKQEAFIPPNKIQYWAMYPQYFLKSYSLKLKFKAQEGTSIRVCFSRSYSTIMEGKNENCQDSSGSEIIFYADNPCHKRTVFNCDPFYFSVEGKKQPTTPCQSLRCSTPNDIQFEFEHEGIRCSTASYISGSLLALFFAAVMFLLQRQ